MIERSFLMDRRFLRGLVLGLILATVNVYPVMFNSFGNTAFASIKKFSALVVSTVLRPACGLSKRVFLTVIRGIRNNPKKTLTFMLATGIASQMLFGKQKKHKLLHRLLFSNRGYSVYAAILNRIKRMPGLAEKDIQIAVNDAGAVEASDDRQGAAQAVVPIAAALPQPALQQAQQAITEEAMFAFPGQKILRAVVPGAIVPEQVPQRELEYLPHAHIPQ